MRTLILTAVFVGQAAVMAAPDTVPAELVRQHFNLCHQDIGSGQLTWMASRADQLRAQADEIEKCEIATDLLQKAAHMQGVALMPSCSRCDGIDITLFGTPNDNEISSSNDIPVKFVDSVP